jgi:ATP adenylyltransferase
MIERRIMYAPWREEFLLCPKEEEGCIFCNRVIAPEKDSEHYVLYRGDAALVMLNLYPYTSGHLLIIPYRHLDELETLTDAENMECVHLMQKSIRVMKHAFHPHGFTLGLNLGQAAGAGIPRHLHWHVVGRWTGDSNFMAVVGGSRLVSIRVEETFRRLTTAWVEIE